MDNLDDWWPPAPKRAADHDPLCHAAALDYHDPECCDCTLIAKVRDHQRGFDIRQQVEERDAFRAKVAALPPVAVEDNASGSWVWRADVLALIDGSGDE